MLAIPLQAVPSQTVAVTLNNQPCTINLYAKEANFDPLYGAPTQVIFCDLYVNDQPIVLAVPCWNANLIVRDEYFGFSGDFAIIDTIGNDDPTFDDLGSRFQLAYLEPSDLTPLGAF